MLTNCEDSQTTCTAAPVLSLNDSLKHKPGFAVKETLTLNDPDLVSAKLTEQISNALIAPISLRKVAFGARKI